MWKSKKNSELDLFEAFNKHAGDPRIPGVVEDMGQRNWAPATPSPKSCPKLAQYELTLLDWIEEHRGYRKYVAIAGKCWPAFQTQFGFCALLCELPPDRPRHPGILRSGISTGR